MPERFVCTLVQKGGIKVLFLSFSFLLVAYGTLYRYLQWLMNMHVCCTGERCEVDIDDCAAATCANNGSCIDGVAEYTCLCSPGFRGVICDVDIDECASVPCYNNATCHDAVNSVLSVNLSLRRKNCTVPYTKHTKSIIRRVRWRRGATGLAINRSRVQSLLEAKLRNNLGQVVHTYAPL